MGFERLNILHEAKKDLPTAADRHGSLLDRYELELLDQRETTLTETKETPALRSDGRILVHRVLPEQNVHCLRGGELTSL